jgi:bis(5'-nucleosyl)-tetraphosphatase (symmetrical)
MRAFDSSPTLIATLSAVVLLCRAFLRKPKHETLILTGKERVIIIGDVHGCLRELEELLGVVCFQEGKDILVFVGDLVRKGPDSKGVVSLARKYNAKLVKGNHDLYATRDENYLGLSKEDLKYLTDAPLSLRIPAFNVLVVHAGMLPNVPVKLMSPNALMTMRNVVDGTIATDDAKMGVRWVNLWNGPQHVVFGHDSWRGYQDTPFATGLDTGCIYGLKLTALVFPGRFPVSVPSSQPRPPVDQVF